jgi:hypothetical protein
MADFGIAVLELRVLLPEVWLNRFAQPTRNTSALQSEIARLDSSPGTVVFLSSFRPVVNLFGTAIRQD